MSANEHLSKNIIFLLDKLYFKCYNDAYELCRDIEVVITGLTRNQFASNRTGVRIPLSAPEKNPHLSATSVGSFQLNPPYRVGEIIFDDEIPYGDEIRLDGGRVDLISSAKQISSEFTRISSRFARFH